MRLIEEGYTRFNLKLKDSSFAVALRRLKTFYAWLTTAAIGTILIFSQLFRELSLVVALTVTYIFLFSSFSWFSIKWCTEHKKMLKQVAPLVIMLILTPFLMSLLYLLDPAVSNPFIASGLNQLATSFGFKFFVSLHPVVQGGISSVFILCWFVLCYVVSWLFAVPIAFCSVFVVALPVWFARLVDTIAPKQNFFGFTVVVYFVVSLLLLQL